MNFNTLVPGAKLAGQIAQFNTGQMATNGEVSNIAIIDAGASAGAVDHVLSGIRAAGGVGWVHSVPVYGFMSKVNPMRAKFAEDFKRIASRNAEAIIKTNMVDGVIIVGECEITVAGLLIGCVKCNIPVIVMPNGMNMEFDTHAMELNGRVLANLDPDDVNDEIVRRSNYTGLDNQLNSATSFFLTLKVMGVAKSIRREGSGGFAQTCYRAGEQIVKNAADFVGAKKFFTKQSFQNACAFALAVGASYNALVHIAQIVIANGNKLGFDVYGEMAKRVPVLLPRESQTVEGVMAIGGEWVIMKELSALPKIIDRDTLVMTGSTLERKLAKVKKPELEAVASVSPLIFVKGTACEDGAYIWAQNMPLQFRGKAWAYSSLEDADQAVASGHVSEGVVVIHNAIGANVSAVAMTIAGMGKSGEIAIVTDGYAEPSDVLVVSMCRPATHENGAFANIQTGDALEIDLAKGRFNTNILAKDQKTRAKRNTVKKPVENF
ncbi:MAG: dihydroxy-acid dehydratase [Firmicutes bacterium]|nr:dihydroxy-acid dehydratase [Bacillota bacterium]